MNGIYYTQLIPHNLDNFSAKLVQNVCMQLCVIVISHKQLCHEVYYAFDVEIVLRVLLHTNTGK